ncbi:DUF4136 domain-containing protein [Psychroserpens algicola]|uniref:DUF4136 domain-containing protein n=1 Tax=Psychroserpens algicola TaxID=1719034 RepID=A0ABT0H687_9FLAO|nr:DUF4136 domain-containing protein [Psychroserpens algicola]MCK8479883.1 DUF4136 domain-containing protein [Psychroserpens algicola]
MKNLFLLPYLFSFLFIFNCASSSGIRYDYDLNEDFSQHQTFNICEADLITSNTRFPHYDNSNIRDILSEEVTETLEDLGLQLDTEYPDLQAGFKLIVTEEQTNFKDCSENNEFHYWEKCSVKTITYTTETLILYVSNLKTNQIVWQASTDCEMNKPKSKLKSYINELVKKLYDTYPNTIQSVH